MYINRLNVSLRNIFCDHFFEFMIDENKWKFFLKKPTTIMKESDDQTNIYKKRKKLFCNDKISSHTNCIVCFTEITKFSQIQCKSFGCWKITDTKKDFSEDNLQKSNSCFFYRMKVINQTT
jgi:hypothetical protein